jgi:hypothetical protein
MSGLLLAFAIDARAECFNTSPSQFKQFRAELTFRGTFIKREVISEISRGLAPERVTGDGERFLRDRTAFGMRLTFDVDRVWKGSATKTLVMYQVLHPDSTDHWKPNTEYLIFASRLSEENRRHLALEPGEDGFVVHGCSGAWFWTPLIEKEVRRAFGRGRNPE